MKVITLTEWGNAQAGTQVDTKSHTDQIGASCPFVGIAIGPDSDDARVLVDNGECAITLQAGRVLPLRGESYRLTKLIGTDGDNPIVTLQVLLFECAEELACEVARPNGRYNIGENSDSGPLDIDDGGGLEPAVPGVGASWSFPYVGRRQARITVRDSTLGEPIDYAVVGKRWDTHSETWEEVVLDTAAAQDMPVAIYVGGTDNAEDWDWIQIRIVSATAATTGLVSVEADTIGEIGAR